MILIEATRVTSLNPAGKSVKGCVWIIYFLITQQVRRQHRVLPAFISLHLLTYYENFSRYPDPNMTGTHYLLK